MGDGKNMDSPDSSKRIGRGLCESTKDEGYIDRSSCLTGLSLKLNICNRILQVFLFIPLASSVQAFKFDLTLFMALRSFAVTGTFITSIHPTFFPRVSNHDG